jgi:hypothetical protein
LGGNRGNFKKKPQKTRAYAKLLYRGNFWLWGEISPPEKAFLIFLIFILDKAGILFYIIKQAKRGFLPCKAETVKMET